MAEQDDERNPYEDLMAPGAFNVPRIPGLSGFGSGGYSQTMAPLRAQAAQLRGGASPTPPGRFEAPSRPSQDVTEPAREVLQPPPGRQPEPEASTGPPSPLGFINPTAEASGGANTKGFMQALESMRANGGPGGYVASLLGHGPPVGVGEGWKYGQYIPTQMMPMIQGQQQAQAMMAHLLYGENLMRERLDIREQKREQFEEHQKGMRARALEDTLNAAPDQYKNLMPELFDQSGTAHVSPFAADTVGKMMDQLKQQQFQAAVRLTAMDKEFRGAGYKGPDDPAWFDKRKSVADNLSFDPSLAVTAMHANSPKELEHLEQMATLNNQRADNTLKMWQSRIAQIGEQRGQLLTQTEGVRTRLMRYGADLRAQDPSRISHDIMNANAIVRSNESMIKDMLSEASQKVNGNEFLTMNRQQKQEASRQAADLRQAAEELRAKNSVLIGHIEQSSKILSQQPAQAPGPRAISKQEWDAISQKPGVTPEYMKKHFIQSQ
jgi:hypothetical protein